MPKESQLSPDAGQIYFSTAVLPAITQAVQQLNLTACIATCPADMCCMVQYNGASSTCNFAAIPWDATGVLNVARRVP